MAACGAAELRRTRRADCGDASDSRRGEAMGQREPLFVRSQLLHAVARSRGARACDLHRLAAAPDSRRTACRNSVRAAGTGRAHRTERCVRGVWAARGGSGNFFRPQVRGARCRSGGGGESREAGTEDSRTGCHRRRGLCRHFRPRPRRRLPATLVTKPVSSGSQTQAAQSHWAASIRIASR